MNFSAQAKHCLMGVKKMITVTQKELEMMDIPVQVSAQRIVRMTKIHAHNRKTLPDVKLHQNALQNKKTIVEISALIN